jgi:hypothetical protein
MKIKIGLGTATRAYPVEVPGTNSLKGPSPDREMAARTQSIDQQALNSGETVKKVDLRNGLF